jgi:hypothetical protein
VTKRREDKFLNDLRGLKELCPKVSARIVARACGSLVSMKTVLGDRAVFLCRYMQNVINYCLFKLNSWSKLVYIKDLYFYTNFLDEINYLMINFTKLNEKSIIDCEKPSFIRIFGDASDHSIGGYIEMNDEKIPFHRMLNAFESEESSTYRELKCISYAL